MAGGPVVRQPVERHGMPRAGPGEPRRERTGILRHPDGHLDMETGVRPGEHVSGLVLVEPLPAHEAPEHGTAERLGQPGGVVHGPRDERPIRPTAAVRDEAVPVRMPGRPGAVRLQGGRDADGKIVLTRPRADGDGDASGGDAGHLAELAAAVQTVGAEPLRDGEHDLPVRHGREERGVQPPGSARQPFGMTARTEVAALARARAQVLLRARVTAKKNHVHVTLAASCVHQRSAVTRSAATWRVPGGDAAGGGFGAKLHGCRAIRPASVPVRPMLRLALRSACLTGLCVVAGVVADVVAGPLAAGAQYRQPPQPIAQILDQPATPLVQLSPDRERLLLLERAGLPPIAESPSASGRSVQRPGEPGTNAWAHPSRRMAVARRASRNPGLRWARARTSSTRTDREQHGAGA